MASVVQAQSTDITDVDILQLALNLEYLEVEFYTVGVSSRTIDTFGVEVDGDGMAGATTGGSRVIFNNSSLPIQGITEELAFDETACKFAARCIYGGWGKAGGKARN